MVECLLKGGTMHLRVLGSWRAGLSIAALVLLQPVFATPRLISLIYNSPPESRQQIGAAEFHRKLEALAGKRLIVDERGSNVLGSELAILTATRAGAVDLTVLTGSVVSSVVPELSVFDIPFLFRDEAHAKAVSDGPVGSAIASKFTDKGLVLLAIGKQGFRNITNSKRPIRTPADLKGLKMRVIPNEIYQMTFKALGAEVVPMDFPLVYAALKDGRIDGQENPVQTITGSRFYEVQKYLSLTRHFFAPIVFVASRATFEQLSGEEQELVRTAARNGAEATWQVGAEFEAKRIDELRLAGMDVVDQVERRAFVDAVKSLDPEFERLFGKQLLAEIRSTR